MVTALALEDIPVVATAVIRDLVLDKPDFRRGVQGTVAVIKRKVIMKKPQKTPAQIEHQKSWQRRKREAARIARGKRKANGVAAFKADREVRGKGYVVVVASMPPADLAELDQMAARCQMSRSAFIRQAVKHFGAKLFPDGAVR